MAISDVTTESLGKIIDRDKINNKGAVFKKNMPSVNYLVH